MQRSIQHNDIVNITCSNSFYINNSTYKQTTSFIVREIKSDEIVLIDSNDPNISISLIPSPILNKWVIKENNDINCQINFIASPLNNNNNQELNKDLEKSDKFENISQVKQQYPKIPPFGKPHKYEISISY